MGTRFGRHLVIVHMATACETGRVEMTGGIAHGMNLALPWVSRDDPGHGGNVWCDGGNRHL